MTAPFIIPFFIAHQGCPHRCVYCDQGVSGGVRRGRVDAASTAAGIAAGLASPRRNGRPTEAAFYGGTFTGLPADRQDELLGAVRPFLADGRLDGLRLSTRPDSLSGAQVEFLKSRGATTVEIGVQSFDDRVLAAAGRSHGAEDARRAAERVRSAGLRLGIQLLPGLPEEDEASRRRTLRETLAAAPDDVRVYPLVVLEGTPLARLTAAGRYRPLSLDEAVTACADLVGPFRAAGINVIRVGLADQPGLADAIVAGPYHPAFGELVGGELFFRAVCRAADETRPEVHVSPRDLSQALGHKRGNPARWRRKLGWTPQIVPDGGLPRGILRCGGRETPVYDFEPHEARP